MSLIADFRERLRKWKLARRTPAEIFARYARTNKWGDSQSLSGKGSNLEATAELRRMLPAILKDLNARSMLDVPCGDFHWMAHVDLSGIEYLGGDIVPELVAQNRLRHEAPGRRFEVIDLISGPVPKADLVFVRDCLVHLSNAHAQAALRNIALSGSTWLLTTTFPSTGQNADISTGQWREIDLTKPPFNLPEPRRLYPEGQAEIRGQNEDKYLGLWEINALNTRSGANS